MKAAGVVELKGRRRCVEGCWPGGSLRLRVVGWAWGELVSAMPARNDVDMR